MKMFKLFIGLSLILSGQVMAKNYCQHYSPESIEEMFCDGESLEMLEFISENCKEVADRAKIAAEELSEIIDQAKTHEERMVLRFASIDLSTKASRAYSVSTRLSLLKIAKSTGTLDCR